MTQTEMTVTDCVGQKLVSKDDESVIDPASVDWKSVDPAAMPYKFQQEPGGENPLGHVKFLFLNDHHKAVVGCDAKLTELAESHINAQAASGA